MLVNQNTFNLESKIDVDWGQNHRIALDLEALANTKNWKIEVSLPDNYEIDEIHGAKVSTENGKTYISGTGENKKLNKGDKAHISLIVNEGNNPTSEPILPQFSFADSNNKSTLVERDTLNLESKIDVDWGQHHRIALDLEALANTKNWKIEVSLPDNYEIDEIHGAKVSTENGKTYISGTGENKKLNKGDKAHISLIVNEGNNPTSEPILPQFSFADSNNKSTLVERDTLNLESKIDVDWGQHHRIALDLEALANTKNWKIEVSLPDNYEIDEIHGAKVSTQNGKTYISGTEDNKTLNKGDKAHISLIVDEGNNPTSEPILPQFSFADSNKESIKQVEESDLVKQAQAKKTFETTEQEENTFETTKQQGKFAYGEAIQKNFLFFEANRSGDLGPDNRIEWRSDSTMKDGSDVGRDLEGGYFDAGDHIKFVQPMTWSSTMLAWGGIDYQKAYQRSGQFDELLEAVKWGTDYFLKTHETDSSGKTKRLWVQVGDKSDHSHWVAPEEIDKVTDRKSYYIDASRPGSDAAAGTASALASASMLFRGVDNAYANKLLKNAEALYDFAETYKGKYSDSVPEASPMYTSWSGYWDELAAGGAWLYKATGDSKYLKKAEDYFRNNLGGLGDWTYAADDHSYGAAMILATESSDPFFKGQVEKWLDTWVEGKGEVNHTPDGFAHRTPWASVPIAMSTAFAAEWYNDFIEPNNPNKAYSKFATRQVDYVLGDNSKNYSYMIGFGDNYPLRPHHRGSHPVNGSGVTDIAQNILYGAIVGGPGKANDYSHNDRRDDVKTNEVGTGYNAPFASAAIAQYDNYGGDALSESELDLLIGIDANGVGF